MPRTDPSFTVGIEEEYLLVDRQSRDLVSDPPDSLMADCERLAEGRVSPEFLRAQIEVGTRKCATIKEAGQEIVELRQILNQVASQHGYAIIAASTHPFAAWDQQKAYAQGSLQRLGARHARGGAPALDLRYARPCRPR